MTVWDRLLDAHTLRCKMWQWDGAAFSQRHYGDIVHDARHVAAGLKKRGVGPQTIVPAVITNGPDAIAGILGALFTGACIASLPVIARGMTIASYVGQLDRLCQLLDADFLLGEERFFVFMSSELEPRMEIVGYRSLIETSDVGDIAPPLADETMFIQFSSGTTAEPLGVVLSENAVGNHMQILSDHVQIDPEQDVGYTWLPLSHDMGLFGCGMLGWYNGIVGVIATPERFLTSPRTWFDDCATFGATVTAGPPFALDVASRAETARTSGTPLHLRLCLVGAEQIAWQTLVRAADTFAPRGLTLSALTPAYGLAEATLAVTVEDLEVEPSYIDVAGDALADGVVRSVDSHDPDARRVVCVGSPLRTVAIEISADDHEVTVSSSSLASGYYGNAALTAARFRGDKLLTRDHGFLRGSQLFVTGRSDDLIVIGGRNVYVQEIEQSLSRDPAVRTGNCAIVASGRQLLRPVVVAEVDIGRTDPVALAGRLHRAGVELAGLAIHHFLFLPLGTFPKTPSGKVQRYRCRSLVEAQAVGVRIDLGSAR